jgi:hypothetical protein
MAVSCKAGEGRRVFFKIYLVYLEKEIERKSRKHGGK